MTESARATDGSQHAAFLSRSIFGSLDGLRAACILAVVWHHVQDGSSWLPGARRGFLGVDMFFVLSGFLIVTLVLRERARTSDISLRNFYARRTLRIFPIYYAVLIGLTALYLVRESARSSVFFSELPFYLFYLSDWLPIAILPWTWSLAAEEQFYLCWPPIEKRLPGAAVAVALLVVMVSQFVNFGVLIAAPGTWLGDHYGQLSILQCTFTPICLGVLLAHMLHDAAGYRLAHRWLGAPSAALVVAAALLLVCNIPHDDIRGLHRLGIQLLMACLIAACVVAESNSLKRILTQPLIVRIGVVSYGMYVFHTFVNSVVHAIVPGTSNVVGFVLSAAGTYVVAELSYHWFEKRFLKVKKRFASSAAAT